MIKYQTSLNGYYYGSAYYPETVSEEIFIEDIKHMKKIGMDIIRIGEFMWSKLEPRESEYHLEYLENILNILDQYDMKVILGTPTPTPPRWLTKKYPEVSFIDSDHQVMSHGSRQHVCINHPLYREKAYQLIEKIAKVVAKYKHILLIQLDNEFKCHVDNCYCCECKKQWHQSLELEYGTVDSLNELWGTVIWSQEYDEFADVPLPTRTPFIHNASLQNSFKKFHANSVNDFAHHCANIIRKYTDVKITHNSALGFNLLNNELFSELDIVGFDTYASAKDYSSYTINLDLWRNMKGRASCEALLLETSTSHAGHIENYVAPHPKGYLQTELFTGFASGLKVFCYWHFRGHANGVEQPHSSVVSSWGDIGMGYEDVIDAGKILSEIKPILEKTSPIKSKVAMIYSDVARRMFNIETGGKYQYRKLLTDFYRNMIKQGIAVEVVPEQYDLSEFSVVFIPFVRYISETLFESLKGFVNNEGHLIIGPMTGDRTAELAFHKQNGLGYIGQLLELTEVMQYFQPSMEKSEFNGWVTNYKISNNSEELLKDGDKSIWSNTSLNNGQVTMIGGLDLEYNSVKWTQFINAIRDSIEDKYHSIKVPKGIKVYMRENEKGYYYFVANMTEEMLKIELPVDFELIWTNKNVTDNALFEAYQNKIYYQNKE